MVDRSAAEGRTIGVFTAELDDAYQVAVWNGMAERAREMGAGIICFLGSRVHSSLPSEAAANVVYRIADERSVDGLIVVTSAIATFLDTKGLEELFSRRDRLPQVSVGVKIPGVASLSVDGSKAVADIVRHLAREHGRRRFALIDGPAGHPESAQRARAVRDALAGEGIAFDERLAIEGSFMQESGAEAARRLLGEGAGFDALVCLNDRMALGALGVLESEGVRIGEEVSLVGFDGIEAGRYVTPPLTSIVQPLRELGRQAVDSLLELFDGGRPDDRTLSCVPVVRQSCGCPPSRSYDPGRQEVPGEASEEERKAVDELVELAGAGDFERFIVRLNRSLSTPNAGGQPSPRWNDLLSVVRNRLEQTDASRPAGATTEADRARMFEFARVLVGETESRAQAARRTAAAERYATLFEINASLASSFELPVMLARLEAGLEHLGVGAGYLALFDDESGEWSRMLLRPPASGRSAVGAVEETASSGGTGREDEADQRFAVSAAGGRRFQSAKLVPTTAGREWRRGSWVLEPLVFQNEPLGYLLLPGGAKEPAVYDTLRRQVSSAIKGALLLEQVRTHEHRLEAEVRRRTSELTRANAELLTEVERRVRLEEEVVDISNRTMQRIGQDIHDDLCQHLAGTAMFVTALREQVEAEHGRTEPLDRIGVLLSDSIARAKQIARGLFPSGLEEDGLSAAIEELVAMARQSFPATIEFRTSPEFAVADTDRALQVYRIVQEALSNALKHSGSDRVEVILRRLPGANATRKAVLVAEVIDYGSGLPAQPSGQGMGLRIMRYRAEKAGIELHIDCGERGTKVTCSLE